MAVQDKENLDAIKDYHPPSWGRRRSARPGSVSRTPAVLEFLALAAVSNGPYSGRIVLPPAMTQIVGLERRTSAVGRDHLAPDRGHDDVANAVAGAAALSKFGGYDTSLLVGRRRRRLAARPFSSLHQQRGGASDYDGGLRVLSR